MTSPIRRRVQQPQRTRSADGVLVSSRWVGCTEDPTSAPFCDERAPAVEPDDARRRGASAAGLKTKPAAGNQAGLGTGSVCAGETVEDGEASVQRNKGRYLPLKGAVEKTENMTSSDRSEVEAARCPKCGFEFLHRRRRHGLRDYVRRLAGQYPFRCRRCGHKFYLRQRTPPL